MAEEPLRRKRSHRTGGPAKGPARSARTISLASAATLVLGIAGVGAVAYAQRSHDPQQDRTQLSGEGVDNGSFTSGVGGWRINPPGALAAVQSGHTDDSAVRITTKDQATVALNDEVNSVTSTPAEGDFRFSAWIRTETPNVSAQLRVREVRKDRLVGQGDTDLTLRDTSWHQLTFDYRTKAAGSTLDVNIVVWQLKPGQSLDVDDVSLQPLTGGSTPTVTTTDDNPTPTTPGGSPSSPGVSPTGPSGPASPTTPVPGTPPPGTPSQTATALPPTSPGKCPLNGDLVPSCGALWGIYTKPTGSEGWATPFTSLEASTGRMFDIVKRYHDWSNQGNNGQFPDAYEKSLGASGERTLYFAWVSNIYATKSVALWRDIAAGKYDQSVILPQAERLKAWRQPVFISFDHEMDGHTRTGTGTAAEYVAASRHIHDVMAKAGVTNVIWVWNPTGFLGNEAKIAAMYPGDAYVDWIAYDPYNFYLCNGSTWKSPKETISGFYQWLMNRGMGKKPFMLAEYGTTPDPSKPTAMGDWYSGMADALKAYPNIKAAVLFNSSEADKKYCDYRLSTNDHTLRGFATAGKDPYVNVD